MSVFRVTTAGLACALLALSACGVKVQDDKSDGNRTVSMSLATGKDAGGKVSVDVPGFHAKVDVPDMAIGKHFDFDGVKIADGSEVRTVNVDGDSDKDGGSVHVAFANTRPPAEVADYYRTELKKAGYTIATDTPGQIVARKGDKGFTLTVTPEGSGSSGTILVTGK